MTRFARAKGSKSSNERAPEDSTPWEVMKEQLLKSKKDNEEAKKREEAEQQRIENYENFLKEHKSQKRQATWCDFPEAESNKLKKQELEPPSKKKKMKTKQQNGTLQPIQMSNSVAENNASTTSSSKEVKKSKKKKQNKQKSEKLSPSSQEIHNGTETAELPTKESIEGNNSVKSPKINKLKKEKQKQTAKEESQTNQQENSNHTGPDRLLPVANHSKKNSKKKNKKQSILSEENSPALQENHVSVEQNVKNNKANQNKNKQKKKEKKLVEGIPVRRKPINDNSFQYIINGKEVELVRFDGFPIMKRDAERLEELKTNMIKKGIPKSEVNRTLKLERRRAEKALARLKRDVCYNCRKGGHNLSDCPELKTKIPGVGAADGVCFKCGSTEHRQFECKVQKDKEFRFATCFICKEPGHIARQCPDNPKGLYPNGGGCKLCGDVTHLRKDCPTVMGKKEETSIKLQTLDSTDNLEGIEQKINTNLQETTKKPKKIKF